MTTIFDVIVVGAGLSGLRVAEELQRRGKKVMVIEATHRAGGRIMTPRHTIQGNSYSFEAGGARFFTIHHRLRSLLRKLQLHQSSNLITIDMEYEFRPQQNIDTTQNWKPLLTKLIQGGKSMSSRFLRQKSLRQVIVQRRLLTPSEMNYLFAYVAYPHLLETQATEGFRIMETNFHRLSFFYVFKPGLERIIERLTERFVTQGGKITYGHRITSISDRGAPYQVTSSHKRWQAHALFLALPPEALRHISPFHQRKFQDMWSCWIGVPLLRFFAVYPTRSKWLEDVTKVSTGRRTQRLYNGGQGLVQTYVSGPNAVWWKKHQTRKDLIQETRRLFPEKDIPSPVWSKAYYWEQGIHMWAPGTVIEDTLQRIRQPWSGEDIFVCGEAYSHVPRWMESALASAEAVLKLYRGKHSVPRPTHNRWQRMLFKKTIKKRHVKQYTWKQIRQHKTRHDAWIVIHHKVYDITSWIPHHPGGDIILTGVGKDATSLFEGIGHSSFARKKLRTFQIGEVSER